MRGLRSSEIEIMLLIISRCAGVFLRNTLKPSVLSLTECHSYLTPFLTVLGRGSLSKKLKKPKFLLTFYGVKLLGFQ